MEIIPGVERRRRWPVEDKLRIVAEAKQTGACFVEIGEHPVRGDHPRRKQPAFD